MRSWPVTMTRRCLRRGGEDDADPRRPGQLGAGVLRNTPDTTVHVGPFHRFSASNTAPDHDEDERIGVLSPAGQATAPGSAVVAGLSAIGKLSWAETGDTLGGARYSRVLKPGPCLALLLPIAIAVHATPTKTSCHRVGPVGRRRPDTADEGAKIKRPISRCGMGEAHAGVVLGYTGQIRYGVSVDTIELRCRCGNLRRAMRKAMAATSNSPVVMVSTGCDIDGAAGGPGSSSSTKWLTGRVPRLKRRTKNEPRLRCA